MMRELKWLLLLAAGACLPIFRAAAFVPYIVEGNALRWHVDVPTANPNCFNPATKAIRFVISTDAYSAANRTNEINSIRAAFAQWQAIPGTTLKFEDAGLSAQPAALNSEDNINSVFWIKSRGVPGYENLAGRYGYTSVRYDPNDNSILETDIILNGVDSQWTTEFGRTNTAAGLVESVVLHEIGHLIGLDHTTLGGGTVIAGAGATSTEAGLSADEIAAARFLYPLAATNALLGSIQGTVSAGGIPVFGASVVVETPQGNAVDGTMTDANGTYNLPALAPGSYFVRVSPLDPSTAATSASLFRASDVSGDYQDANTGFLPTQNVAASVAANTASTLNFNVTAGTPAFRITAVSRPTLLQGLSTFDRAAFSAPRGQSNLYVGVISSGFNANCVLNVTGDGLTVGPTQFTANRFGSFHLLVVRLDIAANATPGLRSYVVKQGANTAYANGYLEILPDVLDYNFDGFDDAFQRRFWSPFTIAAAAPGADPDADGFSNRYEARTGTNPTDKASFSFLIESLKTGAAGSTIRWKSDLDRRYQLFSRPAFGPAGVWSAVGQPFKAVTETTEQTDPAGNTGNRFYRLQFLP